MATYRNPATGEVLTEEQFRKRFGTAPLTAPPGQQEQKKSTPTTLGQRALSSLNNSAERVTSAIDGSGEYASQSSLQRGVEATAGVFTGGLDLAKQALPKAARTAIDYVGGKAKQGFDAATNKISDIQMFKELGDLEAQGHITPDKNPGFFALKEMLGTAAPAGELASDILTYGAAPKVAKTAQPVLNATGNTFKRGGEKLYTATITPEESTRMATQSYQAAKPTLTERVKGLVTGEKDARVRPTSEADTAARHGLVGTEWMLGVQAKRAADTLWKTTISPALKEVRGKINVKDFFSEVEKEITEKTKEPHLRSARLEALDDLRGSYSETSHASLEDLQGFKEGWAEKVPESAYKGKIPGSAINYVRDIAAGKARGLIYKYAGDEAREAYIDYGNLKSVMKAGIKAGGDPAKKSLSRNIWEFVMNQAVTPIATTGGMILYRTGQGLEFVGGRGARTVEDIVGPSDIPTRVPVTDEGGGGPVNINPSEDFYSQNLPVIDAGKGATSKYKRPQRDLPTIR